MRIWIVILAWAVISCNRIEDCEIESSQDFAIVQFFRADTTVKTPKEVSFNYIYEGNEQFYLTVINEDSMLVTSYRSPRPQDSIVNDTTMIELFLPLNPAENSVNYIFETDTSDIQLTMSYSKNIEIFYDECPPTFNYVIDSVSSIGLDSVVTANKPVDRKIDVNIEIYL